MSEHVNRFVSPNILVREFREDDSIEEITQLLHYAYKPLAEKGMKYMASHQDGTVTFRRINKAHRSYLGICDGEIIATISLYCPDEGSECNWYRKPFVAKFGQFAVKPELQGTGIGSALIDMVEQEANKMKGINELALDTAETAYKLIEYYTKRGYRFIEFMNWDVTNYRSVVLSKKLLK